MVRKCINLFDVSVIGKFNKVKGLIRVEYPLLKLTDEQFVERLLDVWLSCAKGESD